MIESRCEKNGNTSFVLKDEKTAFKKFLKSKAVASIITKNAETSDKDVVNERLCELVDCALCFSSTKDFIAHLLSQNRDVDIINNAVRDLKHAHASDDWWPVVTIPPDKIHPDTLLEGNAARLSKKTRLFIRMFINRL